MSTDTSILVGAAVLALLLVAVQLVAGWPLLAKLRTLTSVEAGEAKLPLVRSLRRNIGENAKGSRKSLFDDRLSRGPLSTDIKTALEAERKNDSAGTSIGEYARQVVDEFRHQTRQKRAKNDIEQGDVDAEEVFASGVGPMQLTSNDYVFFNLEDGKTAIVTLGRRVSVSTTDVDEEAIRKQVEEVVKAYTNSDITAIKRFRGHRRKPAQVTEAEEPKAELKKADSKHPHS